MAWCCCLLLLLLLLCCQQQLSSQPQVLTPKLLLQQLFKFNSTQAITFSSSSSTRYARDMLQVL
jgi:hypothetical protein